MTTDQQKQQMAEEQQVIRERVRRIKHQIVVLSGKGGVGKSTVAVNLAVSLALKGKKVGLLDIDIHGPSVPHILGLTSKRPASDGIALRPVEMNKNLKVMSIGFMLDDRDAAVIWRGPMKYNVIKQFLKDVDWGDLDFLIVDSPPGTGDEPLSVVQLLERATGGIIVTTPQDVALNDVRKSVTFCRQLNLPVLGVVENMSGFVCPQCGTKTDIFKTGGGKVMADDMGVPFLGSIPIDPRIVEACDGGRPYVEHYADSETAKAFERIVSPILEMEKESETSVARQQTNKREKNMRIAIPLAGGQLAAHFGHCEQFAFFDVDVEKKAITDRTFADSPDHQPGLLPRWLAEHGANIIIAGGMGSRAQSLFTENQIEVIVGTDIADPESIVEAYLAGTLQTGGNICDH